MKDKSILSRAGIVLLILLVLVLILPSGKIDLASKISASTQASVRAEHQQNFASSNEMEFEVYSSSDEIYQNISEVLSGVRCVRRLSQNYSSYGVCIVNSAFVNVKYSGGGAAQLYEQLAEIAK